MDTESSSQPPSTPSLDLTPPEAYIEAGEPHGKLHTFNLFGQKCVFCGGPPTAYSQAGAQELRISRVCEPCFDYTTIPEEERSDKESLWMDLVTALWVNRMQEHIPEP